MKILVTGIGGFLGSHLADALIKDGHEVYGIDNLVGGYIDNVPREVIDKLRFYPVDLNTANLKDFIEDIKPEVVYHCACTAYEGLSVFSPSFVTENTFQNTVNLLSACIQVGGMKRFIYMSSMSRYGANHVPFTEDMTPMPEDPYAVSKVASEQVIAQMAETHDFEYVIAVPHSIIGPRQKYDDPYRNVASIMANRMLQGKPPIIYGDGSQTRCFSFVQDCISTLVQLIHAPSGHVFNIGPDEVDGEVVTIKELADTIAYLTDYKGEYEYHEERPREVKHAHCSSEKIRDYFGYKTETSLAVGLTEMIVEMKKKGTKPFEYKLPLEIINDKTPKTWKEKSI